MRYVMRARTVAEEDGVHGSEDGAGEGVLVKGRALCRRLGGGDAAVVGGVVLLGHGEGGRDALVEWRVGCSSRDHLLCPVPLSLLTHYLWPAGLRLKECYAPCLSIYCHNAILESRKNAVTINTSEVWY